MPDQVPAQVVTERFDRLVAEANAIAWEENKALVGKRVEVLVADGEGKKDGATLRISGRAADNRLVHVAQPVGVDVRPGDMREIYMGEGKNKKKLADNAEHLWNQCVAYARIHSQPEKQSGRAWHLFKKITGQETMWQFSKAPTVEISRNVHQKIQQLNIAYKRGMQR